MSNEAKRHALTLVELLVVVVILVILVAVVLPLAQPALRGREVREGARQLNSLLARAQADAMAKGKEHGIALLNDGGRCFQIAAVKSRGVFTGMDANTRVDLDPTDSTKLLFVDVTGAANAMQFDQENKQTLNKLVIDKTGQPMPFFAKFDYRGPWYQMELVPPDIVRFIYGSPAQLNAVPFQIRLPPRRSGALSPPIDLPQGAFIAMGNSGWSVSPANSFGGTDVMIMFGSDGRLNRIWTATGIIPNAANPLESIFLLVQNDDDNAPSLWVTIGDKTNRITTTENLGTRESALSGISASGR